MPRIRLILTATAAIAGMFFASTVVGPAWAVPDYPSAEEVAAAKKKVSEKRAMIARLEKYLADLSVESDALATTALIKAEAYNQAQDSVDLMNTRVNSLQTQVDAANAQADQALEQLGQLAAQMYRNGSAGNSLNLFLNADKADDLLYQLGASEKIAQQSDQLYQRSIEKQRYAQALADELSAAKEELAAKAKIAQDAYAEAQAAANTLQAKVDENKALNRTFYAQLASLRNTSADLERRRAQGLADERAQANGTADTTAPELYDVGDANTAKVDVMFNFAKAQLGEPYVLGGIGPNVWDCSGITKASYAAAGIYIGTHSATNQFRTMAAAKKLIPLNQLQPGDLMWYTKEPGNFDGDKYHIVIFYGNGMMLEAPRPGREVRIVPIRWGEMFKYAGRPSAP
jgi:cell wall-associated NlpC family hydrolase